MTDQDVLLAKLAKLSKEGDEDAFARILKILEPDIKKTFRQYYLPDGEFEDILQEARIACWKAVRDFNDTMGMTFKNFAISLCCKRHISTLLTHSKTLKYKLHNDAVSLESPVNQSEDDGVQTWADYIIDPHFDLLEQYIVKEEFQTNFDMVADKLTPLEMSVFQQYALSPVYRDIAEAIGGNIKQIDNSLLRIRGKSSIIYQHYLATHDIIGYQTSVGIGTTGLFGELEFIFEQVDIGIMTAVYC